MTIKKELIGLMISVPPSIQSQLGETISLIADSDFWTRWDTLIDVSWPCTSVKIEIVLMFCRIWFHDSLQTMPKSTLGYWKLHTPSSSVGGHFLPLMIYTQRSTMSSVNSGKPMFSYLEYGSSTHSLHHSLTSILHRALINKSKRTRITRRF